MALSRYLLGNLIELLDHTNSDLRYDLSYVRGVNNLKKLMPTKADMNGRDISKFQIVMPGEFVFNHRTSRNGSKFSIAMNDESDLIICTEDYVVFRIKPECETILLKEWLYMFFNRSEFDRYVITNSWGSSTEFYNWEDICAIELELPPLPIQQKYVSVYKAMIANQQSYERGLEDVRTVCDAHFDSAKKGKMIPLGEIIERVDVKNSDGLYGEKDVRGITNQKQFDNTKADLTGTDLTKFLVIGKDVFAYNSRTDGRDMLVLALNRTNKNIIVTWNYNAFRIRKEKRSIVNPEYLYAFFKRSEFDRNVRFNSWGSSQELLSWDNLCSMNVPCPDIRIQDSIAEINRVYLTRKDINESLKTQVRKICPILVKGSIEEARKEA